jgi:glycerol-3-phosphate O-acyltransferase
MAPGGAGALTLDSARALLDGSDLYVANLVLRPFVDAYLVVADRLAAAGDSAVNEADVLDEALRVGQQWELERRIASAESVSLELYRTGLRLARHRGLLGGEGADTAYPGESLGARRAAFLVELQDVATQLDTIARITQASRSARGLR